MSIFSNYANVKRGYERLWTEAKIRPERQADAHRIAEKLLKNRARYENVSSSVPWWFVSIIHNLEGGGNFSTHLHNGDPLTARTVHVPAGRPRDGEPPFTWEESAVDALASHGLLKETDWSFAKACWHWEIYNGTGYVSKGINSPYVWSFSTLYEKGKYVADGVYDANAVSQQCGAATILKCLIEMGEVKAEAIPVPVPAIPVPAPKVEVSAMQDLNRVLESFGRIAPVIVSAAAGPLAGLAVKALAEAFETEPNAPAVVAKIEAAPLTQAVQQMAKAEGTMKALTPPDAPTPTATPVPVDPKMQPGPIDKVVGGSRFTGWKTIIGGALFAAVSVAEILHIGGGILTPEILASAKWAAGLLAGVGVISKVERWITVFKPQTPTVVITQ